LVARFRAEACSATLAVASLVCTALESATLEQASALDCESLIAAAGGLPPAKRHAGQVVARALAGALADLRARYPGRAVESPRALRP
jgi:NifU-like protein involved in Fe-S cluster formation